MKGGKKIVISTLFLVLSIYMVYANGQGPWEKHNNFWLRRSPTPTSGVGDIIFNTMTKIVMDEDTSEWALHAYIDCGILLYHGFRWPAEFGMEYGGRSITDMTRDPYIAYGACYAHLLGHGYDDVLTYYIQKIRPPFYLWVFTPRFIMWWNRLDYDGRKHFVMRLSYFESYTNKVLFEYMYQDKFYENE